MHLSSKKNDSRKSAMTTPASVYFRREDHAVRIEVEHTCRRDPRSRKDGGLKKGLKVKGGDTSMETSYASQRTRLREIAPPKRENLHRRTGTTQKGCLKGTLLDSYSPPSKLISGGIYNRGIVAQ